MRLPLRFRRMDSLFEERKLLAVEMDRKKRASKEQPAAKIADLQARYEKVLAEILWRNKTKPGFFQTIFGRRK